MNAAELVLAVWAYALLALVLLGALWAAAVCAVEFHREGMARLRRAREREEELRVKLSIDTSAFERGMKALGQATMKASRGKKGGSDEEPCPECEGLDKHLAGCPWLERMS